jgi:hypothetical protein
MLFSPIFPQTICKVESEIPSVCIPGSATLPQVLCRILLDITSVLSGTIRYILRSSATSILYSVMSVYMSLEYSLRSRKIESNIPRGPLSRSVRRYLRSLAGFNPIMPQVCCKVESDIPSCPIYSLSSKLPQVCCRVQPNNASSMQ